MITIERAAGAASFACLPDDPPDYAETVASIWADDPITRDWALLGRDAEGAVVARVGFDRWPTTSDPAFLGSLLPFEGGVYGLRYDGPGGAAAGGEFLRAALAQCDVDELPATIDISTHAEVHADPKLRRTMAEAAGFVLFQEKQGYVWEDIGGLIDDAKALDFFTIEELGDGAFGDVMTRCQGGTLDRNDRHYAAGVAPGAWGKQMVTLCEEEDRASWLLGHDSGGEIVGYVALSAFDEPETATIAHIGVLPEARGNGHIRELLLASNRAARARGFRFILSDVDVENTPMRHAMLSAGHRDDVRNWHKWVHRLRVWEPSIDGA